MYFFVSPRQKKIFSLGFVTLFSLGNLVWKSNFISGSLTNLNKGLDYFTFSFHTIGEGINDMLDSYRSYESLEEQVSLLREKFKKNEKLSWEIDKLKSENTRLRQVLKLKPRSTYEILQAEVISNKPDNWFHTIIIDKGEADGVKPYMPVVANQVVSTQSVKKKEHYQKIVEGLVGKVIQVNLGYSRILLITSQYSKLGVMIKKTGHWALLEGQSSMNRLPILNFVSLSTKLNPGDEIVTSGNQGVFPKGIPVGMIQGDVKRSSNFQESEIKPLLDFQRLDYVSIIKKEPDDGEKKFKESKLP